MVIQYVNTSKIVAPSNGASGKPELNSQSRAQPRADDYMKL